MGGAPKESINWVGRQGVLLLLFKHIYVILFKYTHVCTLECSHLELPTIQKVKK